MTLTKMVMTSAKSQTFMITASMDDPEAQTQARPQHSALTPVRCAECGLFA